MRELEKYDINELYKALKQRDAEILKHYNDEAVSDRDYFTYGINSDIVSSCLSILVNYLSGNIESAGVDSCCRTIIEALVILKMDEQGKISDDQKHIYRYLYAYVDLDNFHSLLKDKPELLENEGIKKVITDKEKATEAMLKHFGCSRSDLKSRNVSVDDPCFYLKQNLKDDIRFSQLLKDYPICGDEGKAMYDFFSIFVHPRCETNPHTQEAIMEIRKAYIDQVLNLVYDNLKTSSLLRYDETKPDFNHDFFYNPVLSVNVHNIKEFEKCIHLIKDQVCNLPNGYDAFTWQFLEKVRYLIIDTMISLSLGHNEHAISNFKTFLEEYSIFFSIGSLSSQEEFNNIRKAFCFSSRMQIDDHFESIGIEKTLVSPNEIKDLYDNFYKARYELVDYHKFYWALRRNSLYFLSKEKKSYNKYVRTLIEDAFTNEQQSKEVMTLYRMSKDVGHASGYNFNSTFQMILVTAHKTLYYSLRLLLHFLLSASLTLEEHNIKTDIKNIVDFIKLLLDGQIETINRIFKSNKN